MYYFLKILLKLAVTQFFSSITVTGTKPIEKGPLLVVGNHPNMLLDSLLIATNYKRPFWFMVKATVFENRFIAPVLSFLHLVPVYRRVDNPDLVEKNAETFKLAASTLTRGDAIMIFPEGTCLVERKLAPIKTGASRIALLAESEQEFELGLRIQPVGITYSEPYAFRSSVTLEWGESIDVGDYRQRYQKDPTGAAKELTADIEDALRELTVEIREFEHQALIEKISKLFQSAGSALNDKTRLEVIARNVEELAPQYPEKKIEIEKRIEDFLALNKVFNLTWSSNLEDRTQFVPLLLRLPFLLSGLVVYYLPYRIIGRIVKKATDDPVELATYKFGLGIVCYSAWSILTVGLVHYFFSCLLLSVFVLLWVLLSAYVVNNYLHHYRLFYLAKLWFGEKKPLEVLRVSRDGLIAELEAIQVS